MLGSAIIEVWITEHGNTRKLVFSGDLGQPGRPILRDPTVIEDTDVLLIESTYGDRTHRDSAATGVELVGIIDRTVHQQGGNVIVPAFAVGRTQEILYHLHRLVREGRLSDLNVFVDSPMATEATRITQKHLELFDEQARQMAAWHALGNGLPNLHFTASVAESMALNGIRSGAIIISASGMCDAGRIKHHLRHNLPRSECSVLITGFQAKGTLGRRLVDGARRARIFGEDIPVRASIHTVGGLSAHADQAALLAWAAGFRRPPSHTYVVHGEEAAALALAEKLDRRLFDAGNHLELPAAARTGLDVDPEHPLQALGPVHRHMAGRGGLVGALLRLRLAPPLAPMRRRDGCAQPTVRCEHTVVPGQVHPRRRHQCREPCDEIQRLQHNVRGAVAVRRLQGVAHLA
ncbi:MAG: MBL fold metallo-hydrolase [Sinobacteraceae bacterium]|nr:MBL fold metallo-hydrolase [Nevskiaceae bacterium]